jgi:hypothetical protein
MNKDIRLSISFYRHLKRRKLQMRLGPQGVLSFIDLLLYVGENKPDGVLSAMKAEDVALAAQWTGDPGQFVATLLDLQLLERTEDQTLTIHHWAEHNGYAAHAPERSERARRAAEVRWAGPASGTTATGKSQKACPQADGAVHGAPLGTAPSPDPSPVPAPSPGPDPHPSADQEFFNTQGFERFWDAYPRRAGKTAAAAAWNRLKPSGDFLEQRLLPALFRQKLSRQWQNRNFIPHPATWLNQKRWEDESREADAGGEPRSGSTGSPLYDAYLRGDLPIRPQDFSRPETDLDPPPADQPAGRALDETGLPAPGAP